MIYILKPNFKKYTSFKVLYFRKRMFSPSSHMKIRDATTDDDDDARRSVVVFIADASAVSAVPGLRRRRRRRRCRRRRRGRRRRRTISRGDDDDDPGIRPRRPSVVVVACAPLLPFVRGASACSLFGGAFLPISRIASTTIRGALLPTTTTTAGRGIPPPPPCAGGSSKS